MPKYLDFSQIKDWQKKTEDLLNSPEIKEEDIVELRMVLRFHEWRYYVENAPLLSDAEYDQLFHTLLALEEKKTSLITADSPTQRVGDDSTADFPKVRHLAPMLSLDNAYDLHDLEEFEKSVRKLCEIPEGKSIEYMVEPKYDGGSIILVYENDILQRAATRGNGNEGDDITANIKTLRSVPLRADFSKFGLSVVELRGEALISKPNFEKINAMRTSEDKVPFANPRNAATGGLRMKDPRETAERKIEAFIYQLGYAESEGQEENPTNGQDESIAMLGTLGFKIPGAASKKCRSIRDVHAFCVECEQNREDYPFEIDGMVVKVNDLAMQEKMGSTSHHPRWAIAYKFKAKQARSTLQAVEFQVGKIGSITPVAKIKPVSLAGVTISSVSLHNEDFINSKDIRIGDHVLVERAGDVIPYIVQSYPELRDGQEEKIAYPKTCPVCDHALHREEGEAAWRCLNATCAAQIEQRMMHFVSKNAMDIDGMGPSIIRRFREKGWLQNIADIYALEEEKIAALDDFGKRSAGNLIRAIEASKKNPMKNLIHGLSIHHVGKRVSSILAERVSHVQELSNCTEEELTAIKDIGPKVAKNLLQFFSDADNMVLLEKLESRGVNLTQTEEDKSIEVSDSAVFVGKSILFTGSLETLTRKEAKALAEKEGARNISAVSSKLNILVVGKNAGSKLSKAEALGTVEIMTEEEFLGKLQENG